MSAKRWPLSLVRGCGVGSGFTRVGAAPTASSHRKRWLGRTVAFIAGSCVVFQAHLSLGSAQEVVIDQIFFGTSDCPNAQYVRLRTLSADQTAVQNQSVATENADGSSAADFGTFSTDLTANQDAGAAMLIGTTDAQTLFGIAMDQVVSGTLPFPDGRICFGGSDATADCVAYGAFTGDNAGFGVPAPAPEIGMALVRLSSTGQRSGLRRRRTEAAEQLGRDGSSWGLSGSVGYSNCDRHSNPASAGQAVTDSSTAASNKTHLDAACLRCARRHPNSSRANAYRRRAE